MKSALALLAGICLATPGFADDAAKAAKIRELFQLTHVDQIQQQMTAQFRSMLSEQIHSAMGAQVPPEVAKGGATDMQRVMDTVMQRVSWTVIEPEMVRVYSETFTEEEIDGVLGFYRSPAGQAFLQKMPVLMNKTMTMMQAQMRELMPDIQRMSREIAAKYAHKPAAAEGSKQ